MERRKRFSLIIVLFLLVAMIQASHIGAVHAEEEFFDEYIYFDLRAGDIHFNKDTYKGSIFLADGVTTKEITGDHDSNKKYYIYQSEKPTETITPDNPEAWYPIPSYTLMDDFFTNNSDVLDVEKKWKENAVGRTAIHNAVYVAGGGSTYDITIDDIYTMKQTGGSGVDAGSFNFNASAANSKVNLRLKGDNRMGFLWYYSGSSTTSSLTFINGETEESKREGSLVVIGSQENDDSNNSYYGKVPKNHWNSVIGGGDSTETARGLVFESGLIYAGATARENCTAIGGGGNGVGDITIKGGKVTAVTESTGAAIGGGIAHQASGGPGIVNIEDGEVYAYNFGQQYAMTMNESGLKDMYKTTGIAGPFVAGSAIGGGSSARVNGSTGTVTIKGGYVYAESLGGSGIGGGNTVGFKDPESQNGIGGGATVTITGGIVESISKSGYVKTQQEINEQQVDTWVSPGAGIGGGSSIRKKGGKGTVTITGGIITTNGIGGGTSTNQTGGDAVVRVEGGTIKADTIGGGFSQTEGYAWGNVTITGGTLNSGMAAVPVDDDNRQVYLTRATMYKDDVFCEKVPISGFTIDDVSNYGVNDVFTDEEGKLYLWIPANGAIRSGVSEELKYEAVEELDGKINAKDQGVLKNVETDKEHCLVNITSSEFYTIYKEAEHENAYNGISFVEKNNRFTYYLQMGKDSEGNYYTVTPYIAVTDSAGNKNFQQSTAITNHGDGKYSGEIVVDKDTQVWFDITGTDGTHYFAMDLTNGNIRVTEDPNGGVIIEQNGYRLSGYRGNIYLTTSGYPTSNTLTVDCDDREIGVYMDKINAANNGSVIRVDSGTMNMSFSNADNLIQSLNGTPVTVAEEGTLHIQMEYPNSLKLDAADNSSAINGEGTLILEDENGFLKLNELISGNDASQICIGTYKYSGDNPKYEAELNNGIYSFTLVGYLDSSNRLHKKEDFAEGNTENFSARGVRPVLTGMKEGAYRVQDGKLEMDITLESGYDSIGYSAVTKANGDVLKEDVDYKVTAKTDSSDNKYYTITVYGSAFQDGNVIVYAAAYGLIPYEGFDYDGVYDANPHTITVAVGAGFKVYYSETELNSENYTTGSDVPPQYTDVLSNKEVYWYIVSVDESNKYKPVAGCNKVTIREAQNEWIEPLVCPDVVAGKKANPFAVAKWGTVQYKYYKDSEGTNEVTASDYVNGDITAGILNVGTYYVKAWVPENMGMYENLNYAQIETDYVIRFRVFETKIYTENARVFEKLSELKSINVLKNGAFTIYYKTTGDNGMALKFRDNLKDGTKLTFIVFKEDQQNPDFYYCNVEGNNTKEIPLTNFVKMGMMSTDEDSHYVQQVGEQVEYQFCVEADSTTNPLSNTDVSLVGMENSTVSVTTAEVDASFTEDFTATRNDGEQHIQVKLESPGGQGLNKILAFTIDNVSDEPRPFVVKLMNGTQTIKADAASNGNLFVFHLGDGPIQETTYTLVLKDLTPKEPYSITGDIRAVSKDIDKMYALAKLENNRNRKTIDITPAEYTETILYAEIEKKENAPYRIYPSDTKTLTFKMSSNKSPLNGLAADLYYKNNEGRYELKQSGLSVSFIGDNANVILPSDMQEGIYRFVFKLDGATCNYNIIISDL